MGAGDQIPGAEPFSAYQSDEMDEADVQALLQALGSGRPLFLDGADKPLTFDPDAGGDDGGLFFNSRIENEKLVATGSPAYALMLVEGCVWVYTDENIGGETLTLLFGDAAGEWTLWSGVVPEMTAQDEINGFSCRIDEAGAALPEDLMTIIGVQVDDDTDHVYSLNLEADGCPLVVSNGFNAADRTPIDSQLYYFAAYFGEDGSLTLYASDDLADSEIRIWATLDTGEADPGSLRP